MCIRDRKIYLAKYRQQQAMKNQMLYAKPEGEDQDLNEDDMKDSNNDINDEDEYDDSDHVPDSLVKGKPSQPPDAINSLKPTSNRSDSVQAPAVSEEDHQQPQIVVQEPLGSRQVTYRKDEL